MSLIVGIRAAQGLVLATDSMTRRGDAAFFTARKLFTLPAQPQLYRAGQRHFFAGYWGETPGVLGMVEPYTFPIDIMPLADCVTLVAHLVTSTARLEAWSTKPQRTGGPVQVVTITQADGARWVTNM